MSHDSGNHKPNGFNSEQFRKEGHELVDLLANYLNNVQVKSTSVNAWQEPEAQLDYWRNYQFSNPTQLFSDILEKSMHVHHPHYMGHQVAVPAPTAALAGLLSEFLNNGMAIYEMGAASTALEKIVVEWMCSKIKGWENGGGILTSGGTLANLTALLTARAVICEDDIWENGGGQDLAVMVSEEAHYCVDRALRIMAFGAEGIIKIPVTEDFRMDTAQLKSKFDEMQFKGKKVMAVVGSAPTTSTGTHDPLQAIAEFCQSKKIWFHVDAAHGGAAILSKKYNYLLKGLEQADSVAIDGHKMMMMPALTTFLLYKKDDDAYKTFSQGAAYLWQENGPGGLHHVVQKDWQNIAKRSFECTKYMMSIKTYSVLKAYGESIFENNVDYLYDLGKLFAEAVKSHF